MKKPGRSAALFFLSDLHTLSFYGRLIYGGIFFVSGTMKLFDIASFHTVVEKLYILPVAAVLPVTYILPIIEVVLGICIIVNFHGARAVQAAVFLLTVFSGILLAKLSEGAAFSCGCFGDFSKGTVDYSTIGRNILFILFGIVLISQAMAPDSERTELRKGASAFARFKTIILDAIDTLVSLGTALIIAFLLSQTIMMAAQNRILKERLQLITNTGNVLSGGDAVPPFTAVTTEGKADTVSYRSTPHVLLFIMKTTCEPCKRNLPTWSALSDRLKSTDIAVKGILLDSFDAASAYVRDHRIAFAVLGAPQPSFRSDYKASVTPLTILVSRGITKGVWKGTLDSLQQQEIIDAVGNLE